MGGGVMSVGVRGWSTLLVQQNVLFLLVSLLLVHFSFVLTGLEYFKVLLYMLHGLGFLLSQIWWTLTAR